MTIEDAFDALLELSLDDEDLEIMSSILSRVSNNAYKEGWADGYADAMDEADSNLYEDY